MTRLMAKAFEAEIELDEDGKPKGSPLQTKINAFTKGKNITRVHDLTVGHDNGKVTATLLYDLDETEGGTPSDRILAKVVDDVAVGSELQTKVNAFTKGKDLDIQIARVAQAGDKATVVVLYNAPAKSE